MPKLTLFISSTVVDLRPVRRYLREHLQRRGIEVLTSEDYDFPVQADATSHDACLNAVGAAHVFVLLIGQRFGGEYLDGGKSITWREWETACEAGLTPIVLIDDEANRLAQKIASRRRTLPAGLSVQEQDRHLARGAFADAKPRRSNLPAVQRFIDALRKGHINNWAHLDWDGSKKTALSIVDARLGSLFVGYQADRKRLTHETRQHLSRLEQLNELTTMAEVLAGNVRAGTVSASEATRVLLDSIGMRRMTLLEYRDTDAFTLVLHRRARNGRAVPVAEAQRVGVARRGRAWKRGQSHVSLTIEQNTVLVAGNVQASDGWHVDARYEADDRRYYASVVSVPLYLRGNAQHADAALTLTSGRLNHFTNREEAVVLMFQALSRIVSLVWSSQGAAR